MASAKSSTGQSPKRLPRYGRIAVFSASGSPSSRISTGTRPCGLIFRKASVRCSPRQDRPVAVHKARRSLRVRYERPTSRCRSYNTKSTCKDFQRLLKRIPPLPPNPWNIGMSHWQLGIEQYTNFPRPPKRGAAAASGPSRRLGPQIAIEGEADMARRTAVPSNMTRFGNYGLARSLQFCAGEFDHLGPLSCVFSDEMAKVGRGTREHCKAKV